MSEKSKSLVAELVIVVVGVLLALGAESVWSGRQDRDREQEILGDLLQEFELNHAILTADIAQNELAWRAGQEWVSGMLGERPVPADSIALLFQTSRDNARFDPVTGVLQSVLIGGELPLIRNAEIRQAVAGWPDRAEEARNTANHVNVQRASWAVSLSSLVPGGSFTPNERALLRLDAQRSNGGGHQLAQLRSFVDSLTVMIAAELAG